MKQRIKIRVPDKIQLFFAAYDRAIRTDQNTWKMYKDMKQFCISWGIKQFNLMELRGDYKDRMLMKINKLDGTNFKILLIDLLKP